VSLCLRGSSIKNLRAAASLRLSFVGKIIRHAKQAFPLPLPRGGKTKIGQAAVKRHWFAPVDEPEKL
jgi:hypothetical protein